MRWTPSIMTGLACLAAGLIAGYFLPRTNGDSTADRPEAMISKGPAKTEPVYAYSFPNTEGSPHTSPDELLRTIPPSDDYQARSEWLSKLPSTDMPLLIGGLCSNVGPQGLEQDEKYLLGSALAKWWKEDSAALLSWLRRMPNSETKRYMLTELLKDVAGDDPTRAKAIAASFKASDPEWDNSNFLNSLVVPEIREAWQKPEVTAEQMLSLYKRLSPSDDSLGRESVEIYPANFDFRGFLDGLNALGEGNAAMIGQRPSNIFEAWAKTDPQAAAEWLVEHKGKADPRDDPYFWEWGDLARGVAARSGSQAYHQWAAQIVTQSDERVREMILFESSDEDLMGIIENMGDTTLRDEVALKQAARRNDIDMFASFSTPEARLDAIASDPHTFHWWITRGKADPGFWTRAGLTAEQVEAALPNTPPPVCPHCQTTHY